MHKQQRIVRERRQYNQWVASQTLEDFALRYTADRARKSSFRVGNTALGPIAFLACVQIHAYLEDGRFAFDLPLRLAGTRHRMEVWEAMQRIPAGETRSYGEIAALLRSSARAVGGACGANPIPLIVPCHRIVAAGGRLGGFMGASDDGFELGIKRWLLAHEGAA